ncbi:hypothetical protein [Megalodesulfovibrio paquesii]
MVDALKDLLGLLALATLMAGLVIWRFHPDRGARLLTRRRYTRKKTRREP